MLQPWWVGLDHGRDQDEREAVIREQGPLAINSMVLTLYVVDTIACVRVKTTVRGARSHVGKMSEHLPISSVLSFQRISISDGGTCIGMYVGNTS